MRRARSAVKLARSATLAALGGWYLVVVVVLFAPIVTSIIYSFNVGLLGDQSSVFTGWTTSWYRAAWQDASLRAAVRTSLVVALWAAVISVVLGSALGYSLVRHPSRRVRTSLSTLTYLMLIVPETLLGVSLLLFYWKTGIPFSLETLIAGLTPIDMSVVALIVRARALTLDARLEEAAADLGSNRAQTLWHIVLPHLVPSIATAALMSFTFSFDNVVVASFLSTATVTTLPVYLYGTLQYGSTPAIYAATTVVFAFTSVVLAVVAAIYAITRRRARRRVEAGTLELGPVVGSR